MLPHPFKVTQYEQLTFFYKQQLTTLGRLWNPTFASMNQIWFSEKHGCESCGSRLIPVKLTTQINLLKKVIFSHMCCTYLIPPISDLFRHSPPLFIFVTSEYFLIKATAYVWPYLRQTQEEARLKLLYVSIGCSEVPYNNYLREAKYKTC